MFTQKQRLALSVISAGAITYTSVAQAATINVAVAANFSNTMSALVAAYKALHPGDNITFTIDSSGNFYTQITQKTKVYDLFLSADKARPDLLVGTQYAVGADFQYAIGTLELYSPSVNINAGLPSPLTTNFVIAAPSKAPYGLAASQVLASAPWSVTTNLTNDTFSSPFVKTSPNIGTTYSAVKAGTYPYGFIAQSYICTLKSNVKTFPTGFHHTYLYNDAAHPYSRILQWGVKIANPARTPGGAADVELTNFINFLRGVGSTTGTTIIKSYCYDLS